MINGTFELIFNQTIQNSPLFVQVLNFYELEYVFLILIEQSDKANQKYQILNSIYKSIEFKIVSNITLKVISLRLLHTKVFGLYSEYAELFAKLSKDILDSETIVLTLDTIKDIEVGNYESAFKKSAKISNIHLLCINNLRSINVYEYYYKKVQNNR